MRKPEQRLQQGLQRESKMLNKGQQEKRDHVTFSANKKYHAYMIKGIIC